MNTNLPAPILSRDDLMDFVDAVRANGEKLILANGCFDVVHVGHIRYLAGAKALGGRPALGLSGSLAPPAGKQDANDSG